MTNEQTIADYYDADYPVLGGPPFSNWDEACLTTGIASDTAWYARLARRAGHRVLDIGAGTGRLAVALAHLALEVTAVEPSTPMRARLEMNLHRLPEEARRRVRVFERIALMPRDPRHDAAALVFGVLTTLPNLDAQLDLLREVHARLRRGGIISLDVPNPLGMGPIAARPSWIRRHTERGTRYTRIAGVTALDREQRVRVYGSYDEEDENPKPFSFVQRLIFPGELRLMLERVGFDLVGMAGNIHGGIVGDGGRVFVVAQKRGGKRRAEPAWAPSPPSGVAATALATAAARAKHLEQADQPVLTDPYALRLAGASGLSFLADLGGMEMIGPTVARARWFDDQINIAAANGARTLISLGAGLCTRAWRLEVLRDVDIIEIDGEDVLRFRDAMLSDLPWPSRLRVCSLDLCDADAGTLIGAMLDEARRPIVVIAEGLFPYLPPEQADALLCAVRSRLSPGSSMFLDTPSPDAELPERFLQSLSTRDVRWYRPPRSLEAASATLLSVTTTHVGAKDASHGLVRTNIGTTLLHAIYSGAG